MRNMMLRTACLAAILAFAAAPALAQQPDQDQPQEEARAASAPINLLADLAEVLGRAHAVRTLCNGDQDSTWRSYMLNLMAYEAGSGDRRAAMTDAFNRGYRGQNRDTSSCTAGTPAVEASIARRGRELSDEIARGYLH